MKLTHAQLCRLSRLFNEDANLRDPDDREINEWLKAMIADAAPPRVYRDRHGDPVDTRNLKGE